MSDNEKKIKISFDLDTTTFQRVKVAMGELKDQLRDMHEMSAKLGSSLIGANVRGMPSGQGGTSSSSASGMTSSVGNNVVSGITRTVQLNRDMLRDVGKSATDVMARMTKDFDQTIRNQIGSLKNFQAELSKTGDLTFKLMASPGAFKTAGLNEEMRGPVYGATSGGARGSRMGSGGGGGSLPPVYTMPDGSPVQDISGFKEGRENKPGFFSTWRPALGVTAGAGMAIASYWDQRPYEDSRMMAQSGSRFGSIGMGMRGLSAEGAKYYLATAALKNNQDYEAAVRAASQAAGSSSFGASGAAHLATNFAGSIFGAPSSGGKSLAGIDMNNMVNKDSQIPLEFLENEIKANPMKYIGADRAFNGVDERRRMGRALGMGGKWDARTNSWYNPVMDMETRLGGQGYNLGDALAAQSAMESTAGFGMSAKMRETAMHFQGGHFTSAPQVLAAAAQMGQDPRDVLKRLSGTRFDQGAANVVGSYVAGQAMSGGTDVDMVRAIGMFQPVAGNSAQQVYGIQGQAENFARLQRDVFGGGRDQYQVGLNFINARKSGANSALAIALGKDPNAMNIVRDAAIGKIPESYKALGLTPEIALAYGQREVQTQFRNAGALLGSDAKGTDAGQLVAAMRSGGFGSDIAGYAKSQGILDEKGQVKDKAAFAKLRSSFAGVMRTEYSGEKAMSEREVDQSLAAMLGFASPRELGLGGSRETGGKSQEAKIEEERQKLEKEKDAAAKALTPDDIKNIPKMGQTMLELGSSLNKTVDDVDKALHKFMGAVNTVTEGLHEIVNPKIRKLKTKAPGH